MSGFGSGFCASCRARIRWDDDVCSLCEAEMERRAEEQADEDAYLESIAPHTELDTKELAA